MSIKTKSAFFFGHTVTDESNAYIFNEGGLDISVTLTNGTYSLTEFSSLLSVSLNSIGSLIYSVNVNRATRTLVISATGVFSLLPSLVGVGVSAFPLIGITSDKAGLASYEGDIASGEKYLPQLLLQDYVDFSLNSSQRDAMVKESASGIVEVVTFGLIKTMECNITLINDYFRENDSVIGNNQNALAETIVFMDYCISKGNLEFVPDRDNPSVFEKVILEKTSASKDGIGYVLKELINRNLLGYYQTDKITFRRVS